MGIGSLVKRLSCLVAIASATLHIAAPRSAVGQMPPPSHAHGTSQKASGPIQALFLSSGQKMFGARQTPYVDAHGNPVVLPAQYCEPCEAGYGGYGDPAYCEQGAEQYAYGFAGPTPMGAGGTNPPIGYDLMNDVGVEGYLVDQRGPYYWDIRAEAVWLDRDETFGRDVIFTTVDQQNDPTMPDPAEIALRSSDLQYDTEAGFRIMGRYDMAPLCVFEFGYSAVFDYDATATAVDNVAPFNLFSLFSGFGNVPGVGQPFPNNPLPATEQAQLHSITMDSDLQTAELTFRRYWVGFHPRVSGTLLAGMRYTQLDEDFEFNSIGGVPPNPPATFDYLVDAENRLAGFQTGADIWIGLSQGLRFGVEGKIGIYNNHYELDNVISATLPANFVAPVPGESFTKDQPAFITEWSVDLVADVLPSWSIRMGYEMLFLNSLVLAGDNFNTASPFNLEGLAMPVPFTRVPFVDDQGEALYQGGHLGLEYVW